jgi:hypothetical protein
MFNANRIVIDAFIADALKRYQAAFPSPEPGREAVIEQAARTALETLLQCDCSYHDIQHTLLVADAGQTILHGRLISQGDVSQLDWIHALIAMLFHDIGYVRGLLRNDTDDSYVADTTGKQVTLPIGSTDASLMPYHVARGCMFVQERFAQHPIIDVDIIARHIEMTRFPVPSERPYQQIDSFSALVRAADLIGQMGDPAYDRKLAKLFTEFVETGEADRLGYQNALELKADFPEFFYDQVYPYITEGLRFLRRTEEGQQWITSLFHRVQSHQNTPAALAEVEAAPSRPHIAVSNQ